MPALSILDEALSGGTVQTDSLELPFGRTGSFAITFKILRGSHAFALRCFLSNRPTIHQRYQAISTHLKQHPLPYLVDFSYETAGIRIKGAEYPILRMQWVDGVPLGLYVQEHHRDVQRMEDLQDRIVTMAKDLEASGIAHGDLQGGNILVDTTGSITLVDYDGMFVPALASLGAIETGHPNFQHPQREQTQLFTAKADRFPLAVIYTALNAIQEDPEIWDTLNGDEEALLFRATDLRSPSKSVAFGRLRELPKTGELTERLARIASSSIEMTPSLDDFVVGRNIPEGISKASEFKQTGLPNSEVPWYLALPEPGHRQPIPASNAQKVESIHATSPVAGTGVKSGPSFPLPGSRQKKTWFTESQGPLLILLFLIVIGLIVVVFSVTSNFSQASVETCAKPDNKDEICSIGSEWAYEGCWGGEVDDPPPILQEKKGDAWSAITPDYFYAAHDGCQPEFPWTVRISHAEADVGTQQYRIMFPRTDDFIETYENISVLVREVS